MKCFLLALAFGLFSCSKEETAPSWKLYKDSAMSSDLLLILDMRYFGTEIQEEECERLKEFYDQINPARRFYCRFNDSSDDVL